MSKPKIHFYNHFSKHGGYQGWWTACGLPDVDRPNIEFNRKKVTCKNCLRVMKSKKEE
jgi:hypothetical protein